MANTWNKCEGLEGNGQREDVANYLSYRRASRLLGATLEQWIRDEEASGLPMSTLKR